MKVEIHSLEELPQLASTIISNYDTKIIAFYGEMSAGKTTFIKSLCECLGVSKSEICSPTYSIVNEYENPEGVKIYHFDFYRIKNEQEAYDMGYEDYFYSPAYCFIEWPEKIANLLPPNFLKVSIELEGSKRCFTIEESSND